LRGILTRGWSNFSANQYTQDSIKQKKRMNAKFHVCKRDMRQSLTSTELRSKFRPIRVKEFTMQSVANIKSISYLKSHAAQISEDLEMNGNPFVITQNGEASMVIESIKQFQEKEELIAALKIIALGEKDRLQGKGLTVDESRAQLRAARQRRK
jgi:Antitoxin Phd_YefM, type II toxin-antitoxin system